MPNTLAKKFRYILVQPDSYYVTRPGYSYLFYNPYLVLNSLTHEYVTSWLRSRDYQVDAYSCLLNDLKVYFDGYEASGWYVPIQIFPRVIGRIPGTVDYPNEVLIINWETNLRIYLPVPYAPRYKEGTWVNVPARTELVIPPLINRKAFDTGWNAGANSVNSFLGAGEIVFSISALSVGVFVGVSSSSSVGTVSYTNMKYAVYASNGYYIIYINNVAVTTSTVFTSTDEFKIVVSDSLVTFYLNNISVYSVAKINSNDTYYLDSSLYYSGDEINTASISQGTHTSASEMIITGSVNILGILFSPDILEIRGILPISCKIRSYYGIFGKIAIGGKLFSKNTVRINGSISITGLIEQALVAPRIPISIHGLLNFNGYIRMPLRGKPIMFINT